MQAIEKMVKIEARTFNSEKIQFNCIDDLFAVEFYNEIVWLKIENVTFTHKVFYPINLSDLFIDKCKNCNYLNCLPNNIVNVQIINCKLVDVNNMFNKKQDKLESVYLSYNRLTKIPDVFSDNVVLIDLNNNDIDCFPSQNIFPQNLHSLNLSYNKLTDLPQSILQLNEHLQISLMPNKFWFNSYSGISFNKKIENYHFDIANRFFGGGHIGRLIESQRKQNATEIDYNVNNVVFNFPIPPPNQNLPRIRINQQQQIHRVQPRTTAEDRQNVHNSEIQNTFNNSVQNIMNYDCPTIENYMDKIWYYYIFDGFNIGANLALINLIRSNCSLTSIVSRNGIKYKELLQKIWSISNQHEHKINIRRRLREEIFDGVTVCFTGKITRLVNSLTGFIDNIGIGYSENEQINNAVIATLRKCERENIEDVEEIKREIKNVLNGLNVAEDRQQIWLDAV
jgi:hypothetical protein